MTEKSTVADPAVQQALAGIIIILIEKLFENPYFGWSSRMKLTTLREYVRKGNVELDELRVLAEMLREMKS